MDFVLGSHLIFVDVQGGLTREEALSAAIDLDGQQAACLTSGERDETVQRPEALVIELDTGATSSA